jgi:hypothetical protein
VGWEAVRVFLLHTNQSVAAGTNKESGTVTEYRPSAIVSPICILFTPISGWLTESIVVMGETPSTCSVTIAKDWAF